MTVRPATVTARPPGPGQEQPAGVIVMIMMPGFRRPGYSVSLGVAGICHSAPRRRQCTPWQVMVTCQTPRPRPAET